MQKKYMNMKRYFKMISTNILFKLITVFVISNGLILMISSRTNRVLRQNEFIAVIFVIGFGCKCKQ